LSMQDLAGSGLWIGITVKQNYSPAGFAFNPASFSSIAERMNLKYERSRASQFPGRLLASSNSSASPSAWCCCFLSRTRKRASHVSGARRKPQLGACSEPLPVRLAPRRQAIADALARQICHG
jgi:hypothetical protein